MITEYRNNVSLIDSLTEAIKKDIMSEDERAQMHAMKKTLIENFIKERHKNAISTYRSGKYTTYTTRVGGGKKISAQSLDALYEKLYCFYSGKTMKETATMESLFSEALEWHCSENSNTQKTKRRHNELFAARISGSELAKKPIKDVSARDVKVFLKSFKDRVTRTTLTNIKTIINFVFEYACEELEIVPYNVALGVKTNDIKVLPEKNVCDDAFSEFEIRRLVTHLMPSTNVYDEAIVLSVYLGLRPCELEALEWSDIHENTLILKKANTESGNLKTGDHAKRHKHLCTDAMSLLQRYRAERPDAALIFPNKDGKYIDGDVINKHLKKACKALSIPYRSLYKTRAYVITQIASTGDYEASRKTAGHSNSYMQDHYINSSLTDINRLNIEKALNLGIQTVSDHSLSKEKTS